MTLALLAGELSNPFNILRKRYDLEGKKELSNTMGKWFCFTFLLMRLGVTPFVVRMTHYSNEPIMFKIFCGSMFMISLIWSVMLLNLMAKILTEINPQNKGFYNFMKKTRKYTIPMYAVFFYISYHWIALDYLQINEWYL